MLAASHEAGLELDRKADRDDSDAAFPTVIFRFANASCAYTLGELTADDLNAKVCAPH